MILASERRYFVCAGVDDQAQVETKEHFTVYLFQEHQELLGAMARQAFTGEPAGRHIERGEKRHVRRRL